MPVHWLFLAFLIGFFGFYCEYLDNSNESQDRQRYSGLLEEDRSPKLGWFEYESVIREYGSEP